MRCTDENGMPDILLLAFFPQVHLLHGFRRVFLTIKVNDRSNFQGSDDNKGMISWHWVFQRYLKGSRLFL